MSAKKVYLQTLAAKLGYSIDWHFNAKRAYVCAEGNTNLVYFEGTVAQCISWLSDDVL